MSKEFRENIDLASVFIANNLAIFGFEDSAAALLQVLKELFDNSIDAIKRNGNSPNCSMDSVRIIVSNEEAEGILKFGSRSSGRSRITLTMSSPARNAMEAARLNNKTRRLISIMAWLTFITTIAPPTAVALHRPKFLAATRTKDTTITKQKISEFDNELKPRNSTNNNLLKNGIFQFRPALRRFDSFLEGNNWFSYADVSECCIGRDNKNREWTLLVLLFIATNVPFYFSAQVLLDTGNRGAAVSLDLAGAASTIYHYQQVKLGPNRIEVRRCLFVDYFFAVITCIILGVDILQLLIIPMSNTSAALNIVPLVTGLAGVFCLIRSAVEQNEAYIYWHGLWHILGAATAYEIAIM